MWQNNSSNKTPDQLKKDSQRFIDVFTSTVSGLSGVNEKIEQGIKLREVEKSKIEEELSQLESTKQQNEKLIGKIKTFLEE